jgi:hypothetical protein
MPPVIAPTVELGGAECVTLLVETSNGTIVNSYYTVCQLINDLDVKDTLKILCDPGNNY